MTNRTIASPLFAALALAGSAILASCSTSEARIGQPAQEPSAREEGGRECFYARQVTGFRNVDGDETRILIDVRAGETFEFELLNRCPELRFARGITLDQTGVGRICDGLEVDLIVPDPQLGAQRCPVTMIRRISAGEADARAGAHE